MTLSAFDGPLTSRKEEEEEKEKACKLGIFH
jgi:hypothetical protein